MWMLRKNGNSGVYHWLNTKTSFDYIFNTQTFPFGRSAITNESNKNKAKSQQARLILFSESINWTEYTLNVPLKRCYSW